jgi:hypothetical protein
MPVIDQRVHSCRRCRGKKDATSVRLLPSVKTRPHVATTEKHETADMAHSVDLEEQIRSGTVIGVSQTFLTKVGGDLRIPHGSSCSQ